MFNIARVAVSQAVFAIDKPYAYTIPEHLAEKICIGVRVEVSFGRGNKCCEAMVLALEESENVTGLKQILSVLDSEPIISREAMRLAFWVRERSFCSLYDVFRAQLPSGLWYKFKPIYTLADGTNAIDISSYLKGDEANEVAEIFANNKEVSGDLLNKKTIAELLKAGIICEKSVPERKISDKTVKVASLAVSEDEAQEFIAGNKRAHMQCEVLKLLCDIGKARANELCYFTGATTATINTLAKRGLIELSEIEVFRRPKFFSKKERSEISLTDEQNDVYVSLLKKLNENKASCSLLFGVTGSGKTLVYMKLIEQAINNGRGAIMLVPEIALTPQMVERFYAYFGGRIAILHSALSIGERFDEWKRVKRGEVSVVVGTRSAIFAPVKNLGIIIMDEEQEHTYKSGNSPRYHAREVAKFRCVSENAMLLLGSATPSIESMYAAQSGKYSLFTLENRFNARNLPEVIIADMREEVKAGNGRTIGSVLAREISLNLEKGEQSILFLNRRGNARYAMCGQCGYIPECPNCSTSLTYHSANGRFMCHHCGYSQNGAKICSKCGEKLIFCGAGTQKLEDELAELFPEVKVLRMDYDTTTAKASHEEILHEFEKEKVPILLGTQMITKGLDFENVTLVGVLSADQALNVDDFRAQESTFSLITQVVGRAGRGEKRGRAVIQTYSPKNPVIHQAAAQDYMGFYESEINLRKARLLPPFSDIISVVISGASEYEVSNASVSFARKSEILAKNEYTEQKIRVYGPTPANVLRVNGKFRYKISVFCENNKRVREMISRLICDFRKNSKNRRLTVIADVNSIEF